MRYFKLLFIFLIGCLTINFAVVASAQHNAGQSQSTYKTTCQCQEQCVKDQADKKCCCEKAKICKKVKKI